jgi:S1-C subfamily serine protease
MCINGDFRQLALPEDPGVARPVSVAIRALPHCPNARRGPEARAIRNHDRIVGLIFALMLLPICTTAGRAEPPETLAEISASPTLAPLVRKVIPGVVSVKVRASAPAAEPILVDPAGGFPDAPYQSTDREISAAGVVVDGPNGLVVTNTHVIEQANDIAVTLSDGRRFKGTRVTADPDSDIAVLRIAVPDLVAIPMGNSDILEVGDYVIAIGNPFGMGTTVSHGIVSALHRSGLHLSGAQDFIQTDASLNPGNSGGPLINLRGELVGIVTAITAPTAGNVGIGFAIPVNRVREIVDRAAKYGEMRPVKHGGNSIGLD